MTFETKDKLLAFVFWSSLAFIAGHIAVTHLQLGKLKAQVAQQTKASAVGESIPKNRKTQWIVLNPNLFGSLLTVSFETNTWDVFVTNDFQGAAILFKRKETKP